jgi:GMP synthase (glutamine-hydrolysing)
MNKLLVFQFRTDKSLEHERQCFADVFGSTAELEFLNMLDEAEPNVPDIHKYGGVIIAGSGQYNVTDWDDHVRSRAEKIYPIIKQSVYEDFPLLGICFGHQLMAVALGGNVKRDTRQAEGGTVTVHLNELGRRDVLFENIPQKLYVVAGHKDSVTTLPKDAVLLANSETTDVQSYKIKNNIYAVQFHPELDLNSLLFRFSLYPEYTKGKTENEIRKEYKEIPHAWKVIHNFAVNIRKK